MRHDLVPAAYRLLTSGLPVRRHEARPYEERKRGSKLSHAQRLEVQARLAELCSEGLTRTEVAKMVGVSRRSVANYANKRISTARAARKE